MNTQKHIGTNPAFPTAMRLHTTATYTPNLLNQYSQRTVPAYAEISGLATNGSILSFQNLETEEIIRAGRNEKWFHTFMPLEDNSSSAITNTARMFAVLPGAGTNGADLINTNQTLTLAAMKTPEVFTHDDDGNLTSDGKFTYLWNAENRLVNVSNSTSLVAAYKYDHQGRRITKTVDGVETTFLWNGNHIIGEYSSTSTNTYCWGTDEQLVRATLQTTNPQPQTVFYAHDGNKNVTELVDSSGAAVAHYEFDPFGNVVVKTGALADFNSWKFSNEYHDPETGFLTYKYRPYNPSFGGWLNRDPIEEAGGFNVYGFVKNDPVNGTDYLGLSLAPSSMPVDFINELPSIASAKGWGHLASLFNFWLSRPPFVITDAVNVKAGDPYNDTIVSMDWIISFGRANRRYNALLNESVYHSANSKARMAKRLTQDGLFGDSWFSSSTAPTIRHQYWIAQESVGGAGVSPDALDAALHKFTLQSLVKGCKFGNSVRIDEIGVYAKDSFDFTTKNQNLGYWAKPNIVRFPFNYGMYNPEGHQVSNDSFRQYRAEKNRGGDFFIFSDIKTTVLTTPYVIKLR